MRNQECLCFYHPDDPEPLRLAQEETLRTCRGIGRECLIEIIASRHGPLRDGLLGLEAPLPALRDAFATAATCNLVRGFAVGRSIFAAPAEEWVAGRLPDEAAVARMGDSFGLLVRSWQESQQRRTAA